MSKATTRDIAKMAGVSQSTVSVVLSDKPSVSISQETRSRVLAAARQLDYAPRAKPKRHTQIGILVPTLSNLFYPYLVQSLMMHAQSMDVRTCVINTMRDASLEAYHISPSGLANLDGILYTYTPMADRLPAGVPAVVMGEKVERISVDFVSLDGQKSGRLMAEHLLGLGHTQVIYISGPMENVSLSRKRRWEGIYATFAERGLSEGIVPLEYKTEKEILSAAYEYVAGKELVAEALRSQIPFTAVIAVNDMTAVGALSALNEAGLRVPDDVSLCGFDNIILSQFTQPALTTVDLLAEHRGRVALGILLDRIRRDPSDSPTIRAAYEPVLIPRASTRKLVKKETNA